MADEQNNNQAPQDGQASNQPPAPSAQQDGQANNRPVENQEDLPEKFKGKSAGDIAKSYIELEKKLGENSTTVKQTKDKLAEWEALGKVLEGNSALYKQVEDEIARIANKQGAPINGQPAQPKDDTRIATENILINNFEKQYAIDQLPSEAKSELHLKIGTELAEMLDPGGNKTVKEVIQSISLDRLPKYLDKAYKLATIGDEKEKVRLQALIDTRQNNEGSFSSIPSSSVNSNKQQLTEDEKKVARRMKISEEKYLENKIALSKQ